MRRLKIYLCLRCGWTWASRSLRLPGVCPHCKRVDWSKRRPAPVGARWWTRKLMGGRYGLRCF
jgi:DNA-directed RNA polymerase subunit RPC12/RpoP